MFVLTTKPTTITQQGYRLRVFNSITAREATAPKLRFGLLEPNWINISLRPTYDYWLMRTLLFPSVKHTWILKMRYWLIARTFFIFNCILHRLTNQFQCSFVVFNSGDKNSKKEWEREKDVVLLLSVIGIGSPVPYLFEMYYKSYHV